MGSGFVETGAAIVVAAVVPGSPSLALIGLEATMYMHMARIYGRSITQQEAMKAVGNGFFAKAIGTTIVAKQDPYGTKKRPARGAGPDLYGDNARQTWWKA